MAYSVIACQSRILFEAGKGTRTTGAVTVQLGRFRNQYRTEPPGLVTTVGWRDRASTSYAAADRVKAPASAARGRFRQKTARGCVRLDFVTFETISTIAPAPPCLGNQGPRSVASHIAPELLFPRSFASSSSPGGDGRHIQTCAPSRTLPWQSPYPSHRGLRKRPQFAKTL